ncbi:uncharacterized protein JN550_005281 [Neoarthrinium moseri]|uniref:uncharacterized protein n=1 Tax=Neoarthrinium moseri TaxID=1658444 RepID=UPI001FDD3363|nr:uncharacterized protein JN550_005281 [Neoarthrinium moseri]KAI1870353.1 hypothetical protein JN550_005281 [Neoarthrinium moseri]
MATNKRRKIDTAEQPQALSAFARLRQARGQGASLPPESPVASAPREQSTAASASTPEDVQPVAATRKSRRIKASQPILVPEAPPALDEQSQPPSAGASTPYDSAQNALDGLEGSQTTATQAPVIHLSNFKPNKSTFKKLAGGKLQLKLAQGERLVILGSYGIRVASGEVTLYGATLRPSDKRHWVHAPHCHALPVLRCPEHASVEVESHPGAEPIRGLGSLSPLFRKLWNETSGPQSGKAAVPTFTILFTSADGPKKVLLSDLKSPPEWNREIDSLLVASRSKPVSVVITGPKSSGKSTFGRLLCNQILTDKAGKGRGNGIAVLDLDPGQPEHGSPGQISLVHVIDPVLSPSFCRPLTASQTALGATIVRSHTLASMSPASDPELYIAATLDLLNHYRNRYGSLPLLVNTPGWVQGTGLDLLTKFISKARPSHVLYMAPGPVDVIESLQESFKAGTVARLPSQTTQYTTRTAAHLRTMQTMSYFHAEDRSGVPTWTTDPLSTVPPWQVRYTGPRPGVLGIMCYDYQTPTELLAAAINGTILAVVEVENALAFREIVPGDDNDVQLDKKMEMDRTEVRSSFERLRSKITTLTPEGIPCIANGTTLDPKYSHTIGLALVRGIDQATGMLQVLTPIPEDRMERINETGGATVLVSGKFDAPSWAYTEDLYHQAFGKSGGEEADDQMDIVDEDEAVDPAQSRNETEVASASGPTPWIEVLRGSQKRGIGSQVWRVRRDLGRTANAGD